VVIRKLGANVLKTRLAMIKYLALQASFRTVLIIALV